MILITGATDSNGSELVKLLASQGLPVRAMVRSKNRAMKIAGLAGVELVIGDLNDPASLARALEGVERAFLCSPTRQSEQKLSSARSWTRAAALGCTTWSSCPNSPPMSAPRCASCAITP